MCPREITNNIFQGFDWYRTLSSLPNHHSTATRKLHPPHAGLFFNMIKQTQVGPSIYGQLLPTLISRNDLKSPLLQAGWTGQSIFRNRPQQQDQFLPFSVFVYAMFRINVPDVLPENQ